MPDSQKLVSGLVLENVLDYAETHKQQTGLDAVEAKGVDTMIDPHRMYPVEELLSCQKAVLEAVHGTVTEDGYYKLGKHVFSAFARTVVGASLTNVEATPKALLEKIQVLWGSVANFGRRELTSYNEAKRVAIITITDDPSPASYLCGVIDAGLAALKGLTPKTKPLKLTSKSYQLQTTW